MNKLRQLSFILIVFSAFSCGNDNEEVQNNPFGDDFPLVFLFEEIAIAPAQFFLVNGNSSEEIFPQSAQLAQVDLLFQESVTDEPFPIREIVLRADSIASLTGINLDTGEESTAETQYIIDGSIVELLGEQASILLSYEEANDQLLLCMQTDIFIHEDRQFASVTTDICTSLNQDEIITTLINQEISNQTLQVNDTLALGISNAVFNLQ